MDDLRASLQARFAEGADTTPAEAAAAYQRARLALISRVDSAQAEALERDLIDPDPDRGVEFEPDEHRSRRRHTAVLVGVAAATIAAIFGIASLQDNDDARVGTDPTVPSDRETPEVVEQPPPPTVTQPTDPWAFDITYIDVDIGDDRSHQYSVAATDDTAWVADSDAVLSTIDLATNDVIATTPIPPEASTANYGFGSVWITHDDGWVTRFDPDTNTVVDRIEVGGRPGWLEPGSDSIWLGTGPDQQVVRIDPATNTIAATIFVGGEQAVGVGENSAGVWVGGWGQVTRIDPETNTVVATI
ncbi:MAG: hypothetical protein OES57_02020, partial [Acidimicrobiia bacterium]|nr:hypothetical protein [Acidimicrobiia bacterium]